MRSFSVQSLIPPSKEAGLLGYGGLVPFIGLSAASLLLEDAQQTQAQFALLAYGATILSFLGAIHWGLALRDGVSASSRLLIWGVIPSLLAWLALLSGTNNGLWLVAAGLWACFRVDQRVYPHFGLSSWLGLRFVLTSVASLACIVAALGAN
jgi:FtsH-binding integral membrane protein